MDTMRVLQHFTEMHEMQMRGLRHVARQNDRIIKITERNQTGPLRVFLSMIWNAFSKRLATNLGHWLAGLPLWLIALEFLGLRQLLEKLLG